MKKRARLLVLGSALLALAAATGPGEDDAEGLRFFEERVRPLFAANCVECHGAAKQKGDLRLDRPRAAATRSAPYPVIVPGDAAASLLVQAVSYTGEVQMPPRSKLPDDAIETLVRWVAMGAPTPPDPALDADASAAEPAFDLEARKAHWSFQPVRDVAPPAAIDAARSPIDAFLAAALAREGLEPAPPAERRSWLRRVTFDLTGLPPTPDELAAFLADETESAFEKVADRLLASPHYAERWARHWLDLVRFAETRGHEFDYPIPNAYQYRDYVIRAFDADVPYDAFVTEHLAGDLLAEPRTHPEADFDESVLGTGFWFLGDEVHSPVDIRRDELERNANKVDVLSRAFLGLTVACARCHDHKFDAITTEDFYALMGFPKSSSYRQVRFETEHANAEVKRELAALDALFEPRLVEYAGEVLASEVERAEELLVPEAFDAADAGGPFDLVARLGGAVEEHFATTFAYETAARAIRAGRTAREPLASASAEALELIHDFAREDTAALIQNGPTFDVLGAGGVRPGPDPARPLTRVLPEAAADADPVWDVLALAEGTERDPGRVLGIVPGRTLYTKKFTLTQPTLYYRVRGSGVAHAVVDSHRVNVGPLHAALVREFETAPGDGALRWIAHDLADYVGHELHVEFSPAEGGVRGAFAVAAVALGPEDALPAESGGSAELVWERLDALQVRTPSDLVAVHAALLREALQWFRAGRDQGAAHAAAYAEVLDAWVRRPNRAATPGPPGAPEEVQDYFARRAALVARIRAVSRTAPAMLDIMGVDEFVLVRGNPRTPAGRVPRRLLEAFDEIDEDFAAAGSGRLALARALASARNPLFARVAVNRVWQHLFGRGLAAAVDDFGAMGEAPSHPELLDWLALRFEELGWSQKALIRDLVLTSAYRRSSHVNVEVERRDPTNRYLARMPVKRLTAEALRDALLAVSGELDPERFGPSVALHLTPFMEGRGRPETSGALDGDGRRSVYLAVRRNFLVPFFQVFDFPVPTTTMGRRSVSNVPAQALTLLNDPFVIAQAERWAERVCADEDASVGDRIRALYLAAFAREPSVAEREAAERFVAGATDAADELRPWRDLCHVLFNVKEFLFLD